MVYVISNSVLKSTHKAQLESLGYPYFVVLREYGITDFYRIGESRIVD